MKNRKIISLLPLLTVRAGYATVAIIMIIHVDCILRSFPPAHLSLRCAGQLRL